MVHVRYEETDIKESPYTAVITPRGDLSKVYAKGPGLEEGNMAGKKIRIKGKTENTWCS